MGNRPTSVAVFLTSAPTTGKCHPILGIKFYVVNVGKAVYKAKSNLPAVSPSSFKSRYPVISLLTRLPKGSLVVYSVDADAADI